MRRGWKVLRVDLNLRRKSHYNEIQPRPVVRVTSEGLLGGQCGPLRQVQVLMWTLLSCSLVPYTGGTTVSQLWMGCWGFWAPSSCLDITGSHTSLPAAGLQELPRTTAGVQGVAALVPLARHPLPLFLCSEPAFLGLGQSPLQGPRGPGGGREAGLALSALLLRCHTSPSMCACACAWQPLPAACRPPPTCPCPACGHASPGPRCRISRHRTFPVPGGPSHTDGHQVPAPGERPRGGLSRHLLSRPDAAVVSLNPLHLSALSCWSLPGAGSWCPSTLPSPVKCSSDSSCALCLCESFM